MHKYNENDDNYIYYWVGKNIKKIRKKLGWTQKELAAKCFYSENFICDIENETFKTFSLNTLYHISKVMGVHIKELFEDITEEDLKKLRRKNNNENK